MRHLSQLRARRAGTRVGSRARNNRSTSAVLLAVMLTFIAGLVGPRTSAQTVVTINNDDGFDVCTFPTQAQLAAFYNNTPYWFVNAYFAGATRACPNQPYLSGTTLGETEAMGYDVLPTYVGAYAPSGNNLSGCAADRASETLTTSLNQDFSMGQSDGQNAISAATALGLSPYTYNGNYYTFPLYLDVEYFATSYTDSGVSCGQIVDKYIEGWISEVLAAGYHAGLYANPGPSPNVYTQYLQNIPSSYWPNDIWTADFGGTNNVWGISGLPDGDWSNDQRISQWSHETPSNNCSGGEEDRNGVCLNIDHDCAIADLAGPNQQEPPDGENSGATGEDPHCNTYF